MFYTGVVENRSDPLQLGRCQVRIVGLHTHDKVQLPTNDLPWATPMQPVVSAAMNGIGFTTCYADTIPEYSLVLPIGISFYTFNSMSYAIDLYRGKAEPAKNILHFMAFISFFPHLVAGPIIRAKEVLVQLNKSHQLNHIPSPQPLSSNNRDPNRARYLRMIYQSASLRFRIILGEF